MKLHVTYSLILCGILFSTTAVQATITVTSLNDSGPGSLRQAIADAAPGEVIDFAITGTITLTNGHLLIGKDLTIAGPGAAVLAVSGNKTSRVFHNDGGNVAISGLTIADGSQNASGLDGQGGGIRNYGGLVLVDSVVMNCSAHWGGGGIYNGGTLALSRCTIAGNQANYGRESVSGGGVLNVGWLSATNCSVSGNSGVAAGGGIGNSSYSAHGIAIFNSCTVCSNRVIADPVSNGAGIANSGGSVELRSSILAGNSASAAPECLGTLVSGDFNLIQNTNGCTITGVTTHNIYGLDPLLGPLADNGGPTLTHALLPGSPAIDQGSAAGLTTDQRGLPRPFNFTLYYDADDGSDIGAYELQERAQIGPIFTVNSTNDVDDGVPGIAHCSLREAIAAANANADTNTIDFAAEIPGLHSGVTGTITLTNGTLGITKSVNVNGPGAATLTVNGNNATGVFNTRGPWIMLSGLTIADGRTSGALSGAGIYNSASFLTISNCAITRNSAGGGADGGGVYSLNSKLTVVASMISSNNADGSGGGIRNFSGTANVSGSTIVGNSSRYGGGGINNSGVLALTNCTVSSNIVWSSGSGGGVSAATVIQSCTFSANRASGSGGGLASFGTAILNTILAGNWATAGGPDASGTINSLDYNLIQDTNGCTITNLTAHNLYNQDPRLGPLADLGGPTPAHALRFDSPAIDAGHSGGLSTDQRGLPRPIDDPNLANADGGDGSDIGAYEADPNLCLTGIKKVGTNIWLSFNSVLGRAYSIEGTDQLPPAWSEVTNGVPGTGGRWQGIIPEPATAPQRFYRAGFAR